MAYNGSDLTTGCSPEGPPIMKLRTPVLLLAAALAAALTAFHGDMPLDERLIRGETQKALPEIADEIAGQPAQVRLTFLDYADDEELVLNARLALKRYPQQAPRILALYGPSEDFRAILRAYGPAVIPPIDYFLDHEPTSLRLYAMLAGPSADAEPVPAAATQPTSAETTDAGTLAPEIRGAWAIGFIRAEGHDFLGQFVLDDEGQVIRVQTERVATGVKRFFTSGLTTLETKRRTGADTTIGDYGWATVDILVPVAIFRLARAGRLATGTARTARVGAQSTRAGLYGSRTVRLVAAGGALAGVGYIVTNPGVLNSIGAGIAETLGLPTWLVSGGLWFVLLLPALILARIAWRWLVRPICWLLSGMIALLAGLHARLQRPRTSPDPAAREATVTDH